MELNDRFSQAGLSVNPEHFTQRKEVLSELKGKLTMQQVLDCAEYFYELKSVPQNGWLADAFLKADPTFSVLSNAREIRILVAQMLQDEVAMQDAAAGLVLLTGAAMGAREAEGLGPLFQAMEKSLNELSHNMRHAEISVGSAPNARPTSKEVVEAIETFKSNQNIAEAGDVLSDVYEDSRKLNPAVSRHHKAIVALTHALSFVKEETDLLWWHISEWCDTTESPHTNYPDCTAALLLPFDVSKLVRMAPSPVAVQALLRRALERRHADLKTEKNSLAFAIDSLDEVILKMLNVDEAAKKAPGLTPVLFALKTAQEVGLEGVWHKPFQTNTGLDPNLETDALSVAKQLVRELDLVNLIG